MTVKVGPDVDPNQLTHHVSLSAGGTTIGLIYADRPMQRIPMSEPSRQFAETQASWTSGRGRNKLRDDPFGYWDSKDAWTMTDGKLIPCPRWYHSTGFRTAVSTLQTGNVAWMGLYGAVNRYIAVKPGTAITAADKGMLHIRRVGKPGTLTFQLANDHATPGKPGSSIANTTVTKTTSDITDYISLHQIFDWTSTQNLLATDWIYIFGASTDSESDHWEVAVNLSGTGAKVGTDGSTWATPSPDFAMYYRLVDADVNRKIFFWIHEGALYAITANADNSAPKVFINGDRGKLSATSAAGTSTVTDSTEGVSGVWATDELAGSWIRFVGGTGAFQRPYQIVSNNTSGVMTITPALEIGVDNTTRFVNYATGIWRLLTLPANAAAGAPTVPPSCRPVSANKVVYICEGTGVNVVRMHEDTTATSNHGWMDSTSAFRYDFFEIHPAPQLGLKIWAAKAEDSLLYSASAPIWGGAASFTAVKGSGQIGATDSRITSVLSRGGKLYTGKEDGLWDIVETTPTKKGIGALQEWPQSTNCTAIAAPDENIVYFSYGNSLGKLTGTQFSDLLNYRAGYEGLPSDRKGYVSAIVTVGGWMFFAIDAGTAGYSAVYAWNGMGINEIWRGWTTGVRVRDIYWQPCPGTRGKLWIDAGGEPVYIDFPLDHVNPLLDTSLNYQPEFSLTMGSVDVEKEDLYKFIHEVKIMSENLTAGGRWVEMDYRINENVHSTAAWQRWGEVNRSPADTRILDLGEVFRIEVRFRAYTTTSTTPPILTMTDVKGSVAEPPKFMWLGAFRVGGQPPKDLAGNTDMKPSRLVETLQRYSTSRTKLFMNANRDLDDDKIVTVALPADAANSIGRGTWDGIVNIKFEEA
jgi:hypothetical protein